MKKELKNCPFCNGKPSQDESSFGPVNAKPFMITFEVTCLNCGVTMSDSTRIKVNKCWNRRYKCKN